MTTRTIAAGGIEVSPKERMSPEERETLDDCIRIESPDGAPWSTWARCHDGEIRALTVYGTRWKWIPLDRKWVMDPFPAKAS